MLSLPHRGYVPEEAQTPPQPVCVCVCVCVCVRVHVSAKNSPCKLQLCLKYNSEFIPRRAH